MKYSIGDKANDGVIFRIYDGIDFWNGNKSNYSDQYPHAWDDGRFPNWRTKPVYAIRLNQPVRVLSFEEFEKSSPWIKKSYLKQRYDIVIPLLKELSLPEDAVVLDKVKS